MCVGNIYENHIFFRERIEKGVCQYGRAENLAQIKRRALDRDVRRRDCLVNTVNTGWNLSKLHLEGIHTVSLRAENSARLIERSSDAAIGEHIKADRHIVDHDVHIESRKHMIVAKKHDPCIRIDYAYGVNESCIFNIEFHIAVKIRFRRDRKQIQNGKLVRKECVISQNFFKLIRFENIEDIRKGRIQLIRIFNQKLYHVDPKSLTFGNSRLHQ